MVNKVQGSSSHPVPSGASSQKPVFSKPKPKDTQTSAAPTPPSCFYRIYMSVMKFFIRICSPARKKKPLQVPIHPKRPPKRVLIKQKEPPKSPPPSIEQCLTNFESATSTIDMQKALEDLQAVDIETYDQICVLCVKMPLFLIHCELTEDLPSLTIDRNEEKIAAYRKEITQTITELKRHQLTFDTFIEGIQYATLNLQMVVPDECRTLKNILKEAAKNDHSYYEDSSSDFSEGDSSYIVHTPTTNQTPQRRWSKAEPSPLPPVQQSSFSELADLLGDVSFDESNFCLNPIASNCSTPASVLSSRSMLIGIPGISPMAKKKPAQSNHLFDEALMNKPTPPLVQSFVNTMSAQERAIFYGLFFEIPATKMIVESSIDILNLVTVSEDQAYLKEMMHSYNEIIKHKLNKNSLFDTCKEVNSQNIQFSKNCPSLRLICDKLKSRA